MIKAEIPVIVSSVSKAKEESKNFGYAEFLFTGGNINIVIDENQYKQLADKEDQELICLFQLTPKSTISFGRPETWFKPTAFIDILS